MKLEDYQLCLDRGWTRCGFYYYKPDLNKSCCLSYQIRIDALNNKPRKSHKKALKKWQKFLDGEIDINGKSYNKNPQKTQKKK